MDRLDREISTPLYLQLARNIEDDIQNGKSQPGSKIPSETELMKNHSVSRVTVRQAMKYLSEKDLIVRRRGLGSFVRRTNVRQSVEELFGLYQSLIKIEPDMKMKLLKYEEEFPDPEVKANLQVEANEKVLKFVRLFRLKNDVLLAANVYIPMDIARNLDREKVSKIDSLQLLEKYADMKIETMKVWIRAAKATATMSAYLQVPMNSPVLELRRLTFSVEGRPIHYGIVVFQGESYELTTQITADQFGKQLGINKYK